MPSLNMTTSVILKMLSEVLMELTLMEPALLWNHPKGVVTVVPVSVVRREEVMNATVVEDVVTGLAIAQAQGAEVEEVTTEETVEVEDVAAANVTSVVSMVTLHVIATAGVAVMDTGHPAVVVAAAGAGVAAPPAEAAVAQLQQLEEEAEAHHHAEIAAAAVAQHLLVLTKEAQSALPLVLDHPLTRCEGLVICV